METKKIDIFLSLAEFKETFLLSLIYTKPNHINETIKNRNKDDSQL